MSRSYYLTADLCLRAQRDNLLGKLCWFPAKAICNTHFESEERAGAGAGAGKQGSDIVIVFFFFVLNEGNAHTDANCALRGMKAGGFLSNTVGDDGQQ